MKKKVTSIMYILLCALFVISIIPINTYALQRKKDIRKVRTFEHAPTKKITNQFVKINSPSNNKIVYRKNSVTLSVTVTNPYGRNGDFTLYVYNPKNKAVFFKWIPEFSGTKTYNYTFNTTGSFVLGKYRVIATAEKYDDFYDDISLSENPYEMAENVINIKQLQPISYIKASVSGKNPTIYYPKTTGATKYEIYRASAINKKYKKIITTNKLKYKDKSLSFYKLKKISKKQKAKLKKQKKYKANLKRRKASQKKHNTYYYKVRCINGKAQSSYSSIITTILKKPK